MYKLESILKFMEQMQLAFEEAKFIIWKSCEDMVQYYNLQCTPTPVFSSGDNEVFLDSLDIHTT